MEINFYQKAKQKFVDIIRGEKTTTYKMHSKKANMTECGKEVLDPTPIEMPLKIKKSLESAQSPRAQLQKMLAQEKLQSELEGYETQEEFWDCDIPDNNPKSSSEFNHDLHEQLLSEQNNSFMPEAPNQELPLEAKQEPEAPKSDSVENKKEEQ